MPLIDLHSDILVDVIWRRARGERRVIAERHLPGLRAAGITTLGLTIWIEVDQTHRAAARTREMMSALTEELGESPGELASYSNARTVCDIPRNLKDDQIKAIAERDGVIGLNAFPAFVDPGNPGLDRYIDHAVYIADLVGIRHLGFGFDFISYMDDEALECIGGRDRLPVNPELDRPEDVPALMARMEKRGFSRSDLEAMAWGNFARVWQTAVTYSVG